MELLSCAITGHRPTRFKFKYKENYSLCKKIKKVMAEQFRLLYDKGVRRFYVGGALGVDMWAGELLLRLKEQVGFGDIELVVALPFDGHDACWDEWHKKQMAFIIKHSAQVLTIGNTDSPENYKRRNYYMVDHADCLLAVYDNDRSIRSGTGMTVNYASKKKGLPVTLIHPDTAKIEES